MIWNLVKNYKTKDEKVIKQFGTFNEALDLFYEFNGENVEGLEIYFEDDLWDPRAGKFVTEKFTVRSK